MLASLLDASTNPPYTLSGRPPSLKARSTTPSPRPEVLFCGIAGAGQVQAGVCRGRAILLRKSAVVGPSRVGLTSEPILASEVVVMSRTAVRGFLAPLSPPLPALPVQIGRASCRERG